jgi:hypothetical protein
MKGSKMDYAKLITKSLQTAWKYKYLWLFGFFLEVLDGGNNIRHSRREWDLDPGFIILIVFAALTLLLILWLIAILSEGALIHGVSRIEAGKKTGLSDCFKAGIKWFPRLFGIIFLATIGMIAVIFGSALFLVPAFAANVGAGILVAMFILPFMIVVAFIIISIEAWAVRFVVLQDKSWTEGIEYGWHMLKTNTGKTIGVALSSTLVQIAATLVVLICMAFLAIPFVLLGLVSLWLGLIPGIIAGSIILILLTGYMGVFGSSLWTYAFLEITGTDVVKAGSAAAGNALEVDTQVKKAEFKASVPSTAPKTVSESKPAPKAKAAPKAKPTTGKPAGASPKPKAKTAPKAAPKPKTAAGSKPKSAAKPKTAAGSKPKAAPGKTPAPKSGSPSKPKT